MTEEEILAAAKKLHDQRHGETHCDVRYLRSCPKFAQAILDAGKASRETPERCGQRHISIATKGAPAVEYTCDIEAGHRSEFHLDTPKLATWSHAGDLKLHASMAHALVDGPPVVEAVASGRGSMSERFAQRPVSLQHDACGARLTVSHGGPGWTAVCVLGPHDAGDKHRALDGTQWDTAIPARPGDAVQRSALAGIARRIEDMRHVFAELLSATCTGCPIVPLSSNPEDGADIEPREDCPVHGEVAELRRGAAWTAVQYERILGALGPEWSVPFPPGDPTAKACQAIETARGIDRVLNEAGIEHPLGLRGVADLASQREGALEHAKNAEDALARIADTARQALAAEVPHPGITYRTALGAIIAVIEENDR